MLSFGLEESQVLGAGVNLGHDSTLMRISNFLEMKRLTIAEFWQSDHNCASAHDIMSFCAGSGLHLSPHDLINLKGELFHQQEMVYLEEFAQMIPYWQQQGAEAISAFLRQRSDLLLEKLQSKPKQRPKSSQPVARATSAARSMSKGQSGSQARTLMGAAAGQNNSLKYLRKHREREGAREKELQESIEKNKIDEEYGMLVKMSELNNINKERGNHTTYRAYKSAEGTIRVRVFQLNKFEKEISLNEFDTIYKNFKKISKENKDWAVGTQSAPKHTDQLQQLKQRNALKSERQQELKNLLVNTVNLTNLLKEQIKIFKQKGIYGCQGP